MEVCNSTQNRLSSLACRLADNSSSQNPPKSFQKRQKPIYFNRLRKNSIQNRAKRSVFAKFDGKIGDSGAAVPYLFEPTPKIKDVEERVIDWNIN